MWAIPDGVLIAFITLVGTIATAIINKSYQSNKVVLDKILRRLDGVEEKLKTTQAETNGITGFRLRKEMKNAIKRGYETFDGFEEVSSLYQDYRANAGNGTVQSIFENEYSKLPKKVELVED